MINCSLSSTGIIHFINNSITDPDFSKHSDVAIWASASSLNITGTSNFINNSGDCCAWCNYCMAQHIAQFHWNKQLHQQFSTLYGGAIYALDNTSLKLATSSTTPRATEPQRPGRPWPPHFSGQFFFQPCSWSINYCVGLNSNSIDQARRLILSWGVLFLRRWTTYVCLI